MLAKVIKLSVLVLFLLLFVGITNNENVKIENSNLNKNLDLVAMAKLADEIGYNSLYKPIDSYFGDLTAYTADCPLCSGKLACAPELDVLNGVNTYNDITYGNINIVASSSILPCGSIVKINHSYFGEDFIVAVVLDRGVSGTALDILTNTNDEATQIGRRSVSYDILRTGWGSE